MGPVAGIVLTGGAGRRIGGRKPFVEYRRVPLAVRVAAALRDGGCAPIIAVGGPATELAALGLDVVGDRWPGEGPLGGLVTGGEAVLAGGTAELIVAACDLGRLDATSVVRLRETAPSADLVVARGTRRRHPSLMRCTAAAVDAAATLFAGGERRLMRLLEEGSLSVADCVLDEDVLVNVNTPLDLEQ